MEPTELAERTQFTVCGRQGAWLSLISEPHPRPWASLAQAGLSILAALYRVGLACGNLRFCCKSRVRRATCPVISVGNITVGGTGKTPMVAYLARMVAELGGRPLIVSRGYGRPSGSAPGDRNDEARELDGLAPSVPHVQNPDRSAAIHDWTTTHACDIVILDDGFQHRRLARDVDIVLIDALHPFGHGIGDFGRVLPRGILREPLSALRRAHIIIITRSEFLGPSELGTLKQTLSRVLRLGVPVLCASHLPTGVLLADGSRRPTEWLRRQDVAAACGIGNPEAFRWTLGQVGARLRLWEAFPDHHAYNRADIERLLRETAEAGLKTLVTTGKDFVKWRPLIEAESAPAAVTVASVEVALVITEGEEVLRRRLADLLKRGRT